MSYALPDLAVTGQVIAAAWGNQNRDNWSASAVGVVTAAGDIAFASGSHAMSRLGIGTARQLHVVNAAANAPEWFTPPRVRVDGSNENVGNGATVYKAFATEDFDNNTMHDTVTNNSRLTINTPGAYLVYATLPGLEGSFAGWWSAVLYLNRTTLIGSTQIMAAVGIGSVGGAVVGIAQLVATDYVEVQLSHTHSSSRATAGNIKFGAAWIGP